MLRWKWAKINLSLLYHAAAACYLQGRRHNFWQARPLNRADAATVAAVVVAGVAAPVAAAAALYSAKFREDRGLAGLT